MNEPRDDIRFFICIHEGDEHSDNVYDVELYTAKTREEAEGKIHDQVALEDLVTIMELDQVRSLIDSIVFPQHPVNAIWAYNAKTSLFECLGDDPDASDRDELLTQHNSTWTEYSHIFRLDEMVYVLSRLDEMVYVLSRLDEIYSAHQPTHYVSKPPA